MKTLNETSVIVAADKDLLIEVKKIIHQHVPESEVVLYGSTARGAREPESDYDVLVITDNLLSPDIKETIRDALFNIELTREIMISAQFCSKSEWNLHQQMPFYGEIARDGIIL